MLQMCLRGVSPIRLILKPKAGIPKTRLMPGFCLLIVIGITFHVRAELHVSVLARNPIGEYAPKMSLAVVADLSDDHLDFKAIHYGNQTR